jgi:hypothetical protein
MRPPPGQGSGSWLRRGPCRPGRTGGFVSGGQGPDQVFLAPSAASTSSWGPVPSAAASLAIERSDGTAISDALGGVPDFARISERSIGQDRAGLRSKHAPGAAPAFLWAASPCADSSDLIQPRAGWSEAVQPDG